MVDLPQNAKSKIYEYSQVYDVLAFRVVVETLPQCYEVLGHIHAALETDSRAL